MYTVAELVSATIEMVNDLCICDDNYNKNYCEIMDWYEDLYPHASDV